MDLDGFRSWPVHYQGSGSCLSDVEHSWTAVLCKVDSGWHRTKCGRPVLQPDVGTSRTHLKLSLCGSNGKPVSRDLPTDGSGPREGGSLCFSLCSYAAHWKHAGEEALKPIFRSLRYCPSKNLDLVRRQTCEVEIAVYLAGLLPPLLSRARLPGPGHGTVLLQAQRLPPNRDPLCAGRSGTPTLAGTLPGRD